MTRKMISVFLALMLCFSLVLTVSAEATAIEFVVDEYGYLADGEIAELNEYAAYLYDDCGVGIFFVFTTAESLQDYDIAGLTGGMEDYFIMIENDTNWFVFKGGLGEEVDAVTEDELRAVYNAADTYVEGVRAFLYEASLCFPQIADTPEGDVLEVEEYLVFDEANLLNDSEEAALSEKLMDISYTYHAQIIVATISSMDGGDIDSYLHFVYDSMGFGYGENRDGVLLLVCMDPREYRILSNGFAGVAIDPDDISKISDEIVSNLSDGDYAGAFDEFADECAYYLDGHINGFPFNAGKSLAISLIVGIVIGLIVVFVLKGQLKSVRSQSRAQEYVKAGSMRVNLSNDMFLYRNVTRSKKQNSSSSDSGSTARSTGGGSF